MKKKVSILWKIYLAITIYIALKGTVDFFSPYSTKNLFFFFLTSFDFSFFLPYYLSFMQTMFTLIHCIPLALYIYRIKPLSPHLWRCLLALRIIFDITGHVYELHYFNCLYHENPSLALIVFTASIIKYIPWYIACYKYAFKSEKMI